MSTETGNDAPAPHRRRWVQLLLVASLTLNVLVLSVIAGAQVRDGRDGRDGYKAHSSDRALLREGGFMPFFETMPREARERMGTALREAGAGMRPDKAVLAADFRDFVSALRAEPFDPGALGAVLATQHERAQARITAGRTILVDQIAEMSAAERADFADALEARFRDALARAPRTPDAAPSDGQ